MSRPRRRGSWICAVLGHDFEWDDATSYSAHCRRCGEGWGL